MILARKKLGEMLLEEKLLSPEELSSALIESKKSSLKLGEYLIKKGIVRESLILDMLSRQLGIPRYTPSKFPLSPQAESLLPSSIAQRFRIAPIALSGHLLQIACNDPLDINAFDAVEITTNFEVDPILCSTKELDQLFSSIYGLGTGMEGVLEEVNELTQEESFIDSQEADLTNIHNMTDDAPVIKVVNTILSQAVREGASDIHLSPEKNHIQLRFRVDGSLRDVPAPSKSLFLAVLSRFKIMANMDIAISMLPQDGRFSFRIDSQEIHVRASTMPTIYGENLVLRLLNVDSQIYTLEELGMAEHDREHIRQTLRKPYGLILITGPTGSGKSTCLYSLLNQLNDNSKNIITLEDPVEYRIAGIRQAQLNRKAGMTFASGLRSILRQDPNIIMVGEIRDAETASIAIQAGMTGHLVFSTLHTNSAAGAITRLIDMGIEPFLVSSVLLACVGQRLIRKVCPNCKQSYMPTKEVLASFNLEDVHDAKFARGAKCYQCGETGYRGRTGIFEVLPITTQIQDLIIKRASAFEISTVAQEAKLFTTMQTDALQKALQGITTLEEAATAVLT